MDTLNLQQFNNVYVREFTRTATKYTKEQLTSWFTQYGVTIRYNRKISKAEAILEYWRLLSDWAQTKDVHVRYMFIEEAPQSGIWHLHGVLYLPKKFYYKSLLGTENYHIKFSQLKQPNAWLMYCSDLSKNELLSTCFSPNYPKEYVRFPAEKLF